jgi:hypothetical protein
LLAAGTRGAIDWSVYVADPHPMLLQVNQGWLPSRVKGYSLSYKREIVGGLGDSLNQEFEIHGLTTVLLHFYPLGLIETLSELKSSPETMSNFL